MVKRQVVSNRLSSIPRLLACTWIRRGPVCPHLGEDIVAAVLAEGNARFGLRPAGAEAEGHLIALEAALVVAEELCLVYSLEVRVIYACTDEIELTGDGAVIG